jgi:hypothetical protein
MDWHGVSSCFGGIIFLVCIVFIGWASNQPWFRVRRSTTWSPWLDDGDPSFTVDQTPRAPGRMPHLEPTGPIGFAVIHEDDSDFDVDGFYSRVREMFADLVEAASARDLTSAAHYIEGTAFKALQAQVTEQARTAARPALSIERVRAASVKREGGEDIVRVMLTAAGDAPGIDPITGSELAQGSDDRWFAQEHWTLVRAIGAKTLPDASIHRCPNCGGPITTSTRAECGYCATRLCDPNRDWVVRDIEGT